MRALIVFALVSLAGCERADVCVESDAASAAVDAGLDASVETPVVLLSASELVLPSECIGHASSSRTLHVVNPSRTDALEVRVTLEGADRDRLAIVANTCSDDLAPRRSCAVTIAFTPTIADAIAASVRIEAAGRMHDVSVDARGTMCAPLPISPTAWAFGEVPVGEESAPQTFTVTNTGGATASPFLGVELTGPDASQLRVVRDGCAGHGLVAGARCQVDVVMAPTRPGEVSATLEIENTTASLAGRGTGAP